MELDKLRPEVAAAIRTMSGEAGGNRDDAYDVIEAELLRLARENEALIAKCAVLMSLRKRHRARAERAESELAALKRRIAKSKTEIRSNGKRHYRVALVKVEE